MAKEFPIPKKEDAFPVGEMPKREEPMGVKLFQAFEMDGKAGVFTIIETDENGEFLSKLNDSELKTYAEGVLTGEPDDRGLQIGDTYDDMTAAEDKAASLNDEFGAEPDDDEEDMAEEVVDAKARENGIDEPMTELPETLPGDEPYKSKKPLKAPDMGADIPMNGGEEEPMLKQFK